MEQINDVQKLHTLDKFKNKYQFLERTLQFVISVSQFSLFLRYSSGFCFFSHSFNVYFSTFLFLLFTHTLQRKYMFLICNGILTIIAKSSVSWSSSPSETDLGGEFSVSDVSAMHRKASAVEEEIHVGSIGSAENVALVAAEEEEEDEDGSSRTEKEERESEVFIAEDEGKEEEEIGVVVWPEDEEEVPPSAANDELNKKFEDFIRKMKEEIRIEAHRQLITV